MKARLYVNPDWNFKDITYFLYELKQDYENALALFNCFNVKDKVDLIRKFKKDIYSLHFEEWKKDRIWDYLNDNIEYELLQKFL